MLFRRQLKKRAVICLAAGYAILAVAISCRSLASPPPAGRTAAVHAMAFPVKVPPTCDPSSVISVRRVRSMMVDFFCGVSDMQANQVLEYLEAANRAMPLGIHPGTQVYVFVDLEQGVRAEYRWYKARRVADLSIQDLRESWDGFIGKDLDGAVLIYLKDGLGSDARSAKLAELVLHEVHHVVQDELWAGSLSLPPWLIEGGADTFARVQTTRLGFPGWSFGMEDQPECTYPLSKLAFDDPKVSIDCRYYEGEKAVALLVDNFGAERYYEIFRMAISGRRFDTIFQHIYGISLERFYRVFDEYRDSGYTDVPRLLPPGNSNLLRIVQ